jgi:hypothetical protein
MYLGHVVLDGRLPPTSSTLMLIGRPSSVVVRPAARCSPGAQRWYSASDKFSTHSARSTDSIGASTFAVASDLLTKGDVSLGPSTCLILGFVAAITSWCFLALSPGGQADDACSMPAPVWKVKRGAHSMGGSTVRLRVVPSRMQ